MAIPRFEDGMRLTPTRLNAMLALSGVTTIPAFLANEHPGAKLNQLRVALGAADLVPPFGDDELFTAAHLNLLLDAVNLAAGDPPAYVLPIAAVDRLGGIKVGEGFSVGLDGTLSVEAVLSPAPVPVATRTTTGVVKVGTGLTIASDGTVAAVPPAAPTPVPLATASTAGIVKVGAGLTVAGDGTVAAVVTANPPPVPVATVTTNGVVKVGTGLTVTPDGRLSATGTAVPDPVPVATTAATGVVRVGAGLAVTVAGLLSVKLGAGLGFDPTTGEIILTGSTTPAPTIPDTAIVDDYGNALVDDYGNYIVAG